MLEQRQPGDVAGDPTGLLSLREAEVLEFASLGLTNAQIAARLKVTVHGVKFHLSAIYRKLGVTNRTEAVGMYLRSSVAGEPSA
jgi:DNA-binding CsgD family transcriptional regulator